MSDTKTASRCIKTPIGPITIRATDGKITSVEIGKRTNDAGDDLALHKAQLALEDYFSGRKTTVQVPIRVVGTDFQKAVWKQIAKLRFGQSMTYGEIASAIGKPAASRAVGAAVGANPIPLLVGCHRVLGHGGKITGYTGGRGISTKAWLLRHEGIEYKP